MFKRLILCCLAAGLFIACSNDEAVKERKDITKEDLKDTTDMMSYVLGFNYGNTIMKDSVKIDTDIFVEGFMDGFEDDSLFTRKEIADIMQKLNVMLQEEQRKRQAQQIQKMDSLTKAFETASREFLEENAKEKGVKVTASGLQYKVIEEGSGEKPKADELVQVNMKVTLTNGDVLQNTFDVEPTILPAGQFFPGFAEAITMMKEGGLYKFWFPPELAFGKEGSGPIPGNAVVIMEVELLEIKGKAPNPQMMHP